MKNIQGQLLGRVEDLVLDLSNGRVVEVLVVSDQTLRRGGKTVAVPPLALFPDPANKVYHLDMSVEAFDAAPAFVLGKWNESTTPDTVAAAYRYFGEHPFFIVPGEPAQSSPGITLGVVERMSKLINMNVDNLQGVKFGTLESLEMDVPNGRIINVFIHQVRFDKDTIFSTIIAPGQISFNAKRDALLIDETKEVYAREPHVVYARGNAGQVVSFREQADPELAPPAVLVQGTSFRDIDTTDQIYKANEKNSLRTTNVEISTLNGHVILRGTITSPGIRDSIESLAGTIAGPVNVDNQMAVLPDAQAAL